MAVMIDIDECISCGACVDACPEEALELGDGSTEVDEEKCIECGLCVGECPTDALSI